MSNHAVTSKLPGDATATDDFANNPDNQEDRLEAPKVITDPNAEVDGRTITQWSEQWLKELIDTPAGAVNGFNDPNGTVAAAINDPHSKMYFITATHSSDARTFNVHEGQDVYLPIIGITDGEGKDINPTIGPAFGGPGQPSFADEVRMVLDDAKFTKPTLTINDKPVANLMEFRTDIFSAGFAKPGTTAIGFFGVNNPKGTQLSTTGQEGFSVVLKDLPVGQYTIITTGSSTSTFDGPQTISHKDIINVIG